MILATQIECLVPALPAVTETIVSCTIEASSGASGWDIWSTIANWAIFLIAAGALWVANRQREQSDKDMAETLKHSKRAHEELLSANERALDIQLKAAEKVAKKQMEASHRENEAQLDAAYAATQAQLNSSQEATRADLDERREARELEMTATYVTAVDQLFVASSSLNMGKERTDSLILRANEATIAGARFNLFVENTPHLRDYQERFVQQISKFHPVDAASITTREHERLLQLHTVLRVEIVEFQKGKKHSAYFLFVLLALKTEDPNQIDQALGHNPAADEPDPTAENE